MLSSSLQSRPRSCQDLLDVHLLARLDRLDLTSTKIFSGKMQGERRSKRRGQSVEFDDYRNYAPGDDLRFIDWNVYARFERLFIKLFLEEEDLALHIAIDASASMSTGDPDKLRFAARVATALAYIGLVKNNRVGMSVFGTPYGGTSVQTTTAPILRLPDMRGRRHVTRAAQFLLDSIWPQSRADIGGQSRVGSSFNEALTTMAQMRVGKGVFVLLSDFLVPDGYERGLRALAAGGGYDTFCLQVLSPGEIDPKRDADQGLHGDLRLTDIESGRASEVTITPALLRRYQERLESFTQGLDSYCAARAMSHILVSSETDLETFVIESLRRRGMLR